MHIPCGGGEGWWQAIGTSFVAPFAIGIFINVILVNIYLINSSKKELDEQRHIEADKDDILKIISELKELGKK